MSDEFKQSPLEQVRQHIAYETAKASAEYAKDNYTVRGAMHMASGERIELIDAREYTRALDRAHLAEDRYAYAQREIAELQAVIKYLEEKPGRTEKRTVQVGDRQSVPGQDWRTSPTPETD